MAEKLKKSERLTGKKQINDLFENGKAFSVKPFRVLWAFCGNENSSAQIAIAVPKSRIKIAVNRNNIKRMVREAYRKNKAALYQTLETNHCQIAFIVIYQTSTIPDYASIEAKIILILQRLGESITKQRSD